MNRDISWIAAVTGGVIHGEETAVAAAAMIQSVQTDSRLCSSHSLYIARPGENGDGHDYIESAARNGAVAAVVEHVTQCDIAQVVVEDATVALGKIAQAYLRELRQSGEITVIGITGSAGKTTTKDMLGQVLSGVGSTVYPVNSFNNEVGCPLTILRADEDTRYLVLEMGASGVGHLDYLTEIAPLDIAVVLMVGKAHLGGFGSVEALAGAKAELLTGLVPGGVAVLNEDDPNVAQMARLADNVLFFSKKNAGAAVSASNVVLQDGAAPKFTLHWKDQEAAVKLHFVGEHQVSNALAAAAAALAAAVPFAQVVQGLQDATALSGHRMNVVSGVCAGQKITVIDDAYNANPDSMIAGLDAAAQLANGGRLVAVLGQMLELGDDSTELHSQVGAHLLTLNPAVVITVGQDAAIITQMLKDLAEVSAANNSDEAFRMLTGTIADGDTVFLKGSFGSKVWQIADQLIDSMGDSAAGQEKNEV